MIQASNCGAQTVVAHFSKNETTFKICQEINLFFSISNDFKNVFNESLGNVVVAVAVVVVAVAVVVVAVAVAVVAAGVPWIVVRRD